MEIRKNEDRYFEWKKRVYALSLAEAELIKKFESKEITERQKNKLQRAINPLWIKVWDYYPDKNASIEKAFKLNFR